MEPAERFFIEIITALSSQHPNVFPGKMMSSPGIVYKTKVFAFYYHDMMVFRLGKSFVPEDHGIIEYSYLSPFKNKPPMRGWLEVPYKYHNQWESLAIKAMEKIKSGD